MFGGSGKGVHSTCIGDNTYNKLFRTVGKVMRIIFAVSK